MKMELLPGQLIILGGYYVTLKSSVDVVIQYLVPFIIFYRSVSFITSNDICINIVFYEDRTSTWPTLMLLSSVVITKSSGYHNSVSCLFHEFLRNTSLLTETHLTLELLEWCLTTKNYYRI